MVNHTISRLIRLPRQAVFQVLEQPEAIPTWSPLEDTQEGTRLTHTAHLEPKGPLRFIAPLASSRVRVAVAANLDRLNHQLEVRDRQGESSGQVA